MTNNIALPHNHNSNTAALIGSMPEQDIFNNIAEIFSIISDPTRVKILWLLCHTSDCVANIAATVGMSSPAVSHHLRILKQCGTLTFERHGKEIYYTLADTAISRQIHQIVDIIFYFNSKGRY